MENTKCIIRPPIKVYPLYELSVGMLNELIERGEVFDVDSSILSQDRRDKERDLFWSSGTDSK